MKIHLLRDRQAFGPFSAEAIREMVKLGVVFESDLARYEGATEWIALARLRDCTAPEPAEISPFAFEDSVPVVPAELRKLGPSLTLAAMGGLIIAGLGGWIWTLVAVAADREFRIVALIIASCCAGAVVYCSLGGRGLRFQLLACAVTLVGILIGKCGVAWYLTRLTGEADGTSPGPVSWANVPELLADAFPRHFLHTFGASDLLWILLALITAWKIPGRVPEEN